MADVTKPNIVFVLCDNVGWGDFGVYGGGHADPSHRPARRRGHPVQQLRRRVAVLADAFGDLDGP